MTTRAPRAASARSSATTRARLAASSSLVGSSTRTTAARRARARASATRCCWAPLKAWSGAGMIVVGLAVILTNLDQHVVWAVVAAVGIGAAVGVFTGFMVAKVHIPGFVVTLALFLAWQGVLLF